MKNTAVITGLCFFLALTLAAAPVRVALIGDPGMVDPVTAELSQHDNIELLERNEIEKISAEHRLRDAGFSVATLSEHFPHADVFAVFTRGRLIVFNAKNGFRLWDGKPENPAGHIRFAIAKREKKDPVFLSVVSVRNVGIPRVLEPKMEELTVLLEQNLMLSPEIQILERERLASVRDERVLTKKEFSLLPSAKLLTFEFEPGRKEAEVNVRLLIRNTGGKMLGECSEKDAFRNLPSAVISLRKQLDVFLIRTPRLNEDAKAEAMRYFKEFSALRNSRYDLTPECTAKLEAALALDPDNPKYRYEEIRYRAELIENLPYPQRVAEWRPQWERCRSFRERFPKWKGDGVMYTGNVLPGLRGIGRPGTADYALAGEILAQMRIYAEKEERLWRKPEIPPKTVKDLDSLFFIYSRKYYSGSYVSLPLCLAEQLKGEFEFLRCVENFLETHPDQRKQVEIFLNRFGSWPSIDMEKSLSGFPDRERVVTDHLKSPEMTEYLQFLSRSRLPQLKRIHIILKNMRKMVNGPRTAENFRTGLRTLFSELEREFPEDLATSDRPQNWAEAIRYHGNLESFFKIMLHDGKFYDEEKRCYQLEHKKNSAWQTLENAIRHGTLEELAEQVDAMHRYNYYRITQNRTANLYCMLANRLFDGNGEFQNRTAKKLFHKANSHFHIRTDRYENRWGGLFTSDRIEILVGAARSCSETMVLVQSKPKKSDGRGPIRCLRLARISDDGTVSRLIDTPLAEGSFERQDDSFVRPASPIVSDSRHVVIADLNRNIHIYDRKTKRWTEIPDAAPSKITTLVIASGRIWGLCSGGIVDKEFCTMFSHAMDGSDRQIHFSTARDNPQNELDSMKIWHVSSLIVSGTDLYFAVTTGGRTIIYSFSLETKEFSRIVEFPFTGAGITHLWKQKNLVYCFTMGHGERIYRIDPDRKKAEWIFNQTGSRYQFDPPDAKPVVLKNGGWQMNCPWAFHGKMLYSANCTPGAIQLEDVENSPLLLLPGCAYVFETADGVLYLGRERYFFVREKNSCSSLERREK